MALGNSKVKAVQAKVSKILHAHLDKSPFLLNFGYQSVIGKLNYLAQNMRPVIVYVAHQLTKYLSDPRPKRASWGSGNLTDLLIEDDS
jgi:hypothetical protein